MGWFSRRFGRDVVRPPATTREDTVNKRVVEANTYAMYRLISQIRDVSQSREYKYAEYDIMSVDVIIKAALNMYADDATQMDENSREILSVKSSDSILKRDIESFLTRIGMNEKLRDVAYALGKYGNKYWKIYLTDNRKDIDHVEEIDDPGTVLDLWYQGQPVYYAHDPDDRHLYRNGEELDLYDHNSFVHFYIHSGDESEVIELTDQTHFDSDGDPIILKYKILEGESLIEAVRVVWRIIRSLEDSMLAARLAKSDFVRIFNIEVGDSSTSDTRLIVNKVKKLFDSSVSMDIRNGQYVATKQRRAWADPIFNSVSDGKGAISIENVGGDFEVKSLVDLEYFNNQLFAGLRIPKTLMGFEESINGGLSNESTLVQLDIRYGKYIKKVIDALSDGITQLVNIWLKIKGRSHQIGKFQIVYSSPSSTEELAKLQELSQRVEIVAGLVNTISAASTGINKVRLIDSLLNEFIPYPGFLDKVRPILKSAMDDAVLDDKIQELTKKNQIKNLKENPENTPLPNVSGGTDIDTSIDFDDGQSNDMADIDAILTNL